MRFPMWFFRNVPRWFFIRRNRNSIRFSSECFVQLSHRLAGLGVEAVITQTIFARENDKSPR